MKKIAIVICSIACSILYTVSYAQTGWVKQKLDDRIGVKFPEKPETMASAEGVGFKYVVDDSSELVASFTDFAAMGLDSAIMTSLVPTKDFIEQFKVGFLNSLPGYEITHFETGKWNEQNCYNIECNNAEKKIKVFQKFIFIGSKAYILFFMSPGNGDLKIKDAFLNSAEYM